jgi:pimeloyl-ACP methyl ester carboxylesterase
MTPRRGSLESVGSLADNAEVMIERITQLDRLLPLEGPVYILGYSRGTNVALEVASRLSELKKTTRWADHIQGIVSLSGPIFGTPLSDPQDPPAGFPVTTLARIGEQLESCEAGESPRQRWAKIHKNARVWKEAITTIIADSQALSGPPELAWEGIKPEAINLKSALEVLKGVLLDDLFRLSKPVREYCENLRRFQLFAGKVFEGSEVMTTDQMESWFRTHTLPEDLDYISVHASMMDASRRDQVVFEGQNKLSYDVGSPDLQLSRTNFYQIVASSGLEMNDGFVPVHRGSFYPGLHQRLNPLQKPYATRTIGVLWQHHLGITIPAGIATADGGVSPFPRRAFLSALARFVQY